MQNKLKTIVNGLKSYIDNNISILRKYTDDKVAEISANTQPEVTSEQDVLLVMTELDIINPVTNLDNKIYTSHNGKIYSL